MPQSIQADYVLESHFEKDSWTSVRRGKKEPGKTVQLAAACLVRLTRYCSGEQWVMRRAPHVARRDVMSGKWGNVKERDHSEYLVIDRRVILK